MVRLRRMIFMSLPRPSATRWGLRPLSQRNSFAVMLASLPCPSGTPSKRRGILHPHTCSTKPSRSLAQSYDDACVGKADGWEERACAVALTVCKDLLAPFSSLEKIREKNCIFQFTIDGLALKSPIKSDYQRHSIRKYKYLPIYR